MPPDELRALKLKKKKDFAWYRHINYAWGTVIARL